MNRNTQLVKPLILTIDDDDMTRVMLKDILTKEDFEINGAANGVAGIEAFKLRRPDLVILDVMMPVMNGFDCLQALRALPGTAMLPIIMLTGADDVESIHRSFELGATDFIPKPINWPTLQHRLRYMLRASQALSAVSTSESMLRNAQKIARLGNWEWSPDMDCMTWSEEVVNVLGLTADPFAGKLQDLYNSIMQQDVRQLQQAMNACLKQGKSFSVDFRVKLADDTLKIVQMQGQAMQQFNDSVHVLGTVQDITEHRKVEEKIRFLSYHDPLTGLPNRTFFKEVLSQAMSYCHRYNLPLASLFISLDNFSKINEAFGSAAKDAVLKEFSERLVLAVRSSDFIAAAGADVEAQESTVARLSDSEFTVLLNHIHDTRDSVKVAQRILDGISVPFVIDGNDTYLELNIGIAVYPDDGTDINTFIKNGESAMNHSHEQGKNSFQFGSQTLSDAAFRKLSLESNLRRAIERNELVMHYQPKIRLQNNQIVGMESLIRWQHPEFGLVSPNQFIPVAEESGLIVPISEWIIETACHQMGQWQLEGLPPMVVAINISASHFRHKRFMPSIKSILDNTGLSPEFLKLELTESVLLGDVTEVTQTLQALNAMGIEISIDDFGTGYSSMAYLKKLPISELKIDRSFICDIPHDEDDMVITSTIISLAKNLRMEVVAEGVETKQQADFLLKKGCDIAQGFLYSRPIPAKDFSAFVRAYNF